MRENPGGNVALPFIVGRDGLIAQLQEVLDNQSVLIVAERLYAIALFMFFVGPQVVHSQHLTSNGHPTTNSRNITVIATENAVDIGRGSESSVEIRYHWMNDAQVSISFPQELRAQFVGDLTALPDYSQYEKSLPRLVHYVINERGQSRYMVGAGANQLDIHEGHTNYGMVNFYRDSGLGVADALSRGWNPDQYLIEDEWVDAQDGYRQYSVRPYDTPERVVNEVRLYPADGFEKLAERLEFYRDGTLVLVVTNSDFTDFDGFVFPGFITYERPSNPNLIHFYNIQSAVPDLPLSVELSSAPRPRSGGRTFVHDKNGVSREFEEERLALSTIVDAIERVSVSEEAGVEATVNVGSTDSGFLDIPSNENESSTQTESLSYSTRVQWSALVLSVVIGGIVVTLLIRNACTKVLH